MEEREILAEIPGGGGGMVFTQRVNPDGSTTNLRARRATPAELESGLPMVKPPVNRTPPSKVVKAELVTEGTSGSHNTHARAAPSGSKQWVPCTASLALGEANRHRIPEDTGSRYASEGTEAHDWAAGVLYHHLPDANVPADLKPIPIEEVPANFRPHVKAYVDHCVEQAQGALAVYIEASIPLFYQPSENGTADFGAVFADRVVIRDLKYGAGVLVEAHDNSQLSIYALSLVRSLDTELPIDTAIDIAPYQPRHHEGADQEPWVITLADLELYGAELGAAAHKALAAVDAVMEQPTGVDRDCDWVLSVTEHVVFAPGEGDGGACRWCDAKAICDKRLEALAADLPHSDPRDFISSMPDESKEDKKLPVEQRLAKHGPIDAEFLVGVFKSSSGLRKYFDDVAEYLSARELNGEHTTGVKLVMGREGNRKWKDEEGVDKWLTGHLKQKERYDFKLKGPAKIETLLHDKLEKSTRTRNKFESMIERAPAKKVLALESDKRQAVQADVSTMPDESEEEFEI